MTVTVLDLDPAHSPVQVTIQRPDLSPLDRNGNVAAGQFGITSGPVAYFDTSGATVGETAELGWDGSVGRWFLHSGPVADQPHLMMARHEEAAAMARLRNDAWRRGPVGEPHEDAIGKPARPWRVDD